MKHYSRKQRIIKILAAALIILAFIAEWKIEDRLEEEALRRAGVKIYPMCNQHIQP